ncbi:hypothetical protein P886_0617 [Alteromonadaceae bacterium 2753L.S.0a.02]|nr:hypothetical protein P886_0617 [Alteromonadaceae bacterium 2753L.S.0a.02]
MYKKLAVTFGLFFLAIFLTPLSVIFASRSVGVNTVISLVLFAISHFVFWFYMAGFGVLMYMLCICHGIVILIFTKKKG